MENQEKYLNENNYQNINNKIKLVGIIVLILGIIIIGVGIFLIISANNMNVPKMGDPDWFDLSKSQSSNRFAGIAVCMLGVFVTFVGCGLRFIIPNRRKILAYQVQQMMPVAQEGIEKIAPATGIAAKEISKGITQGIREGLKEETNNSETTNNNEENK